MQCLHHYFPGGNTPEGFLSFYSEILDNPGFSEPKKPKKMAVIKGGPGTGKSTFLKSLGKTLGERGEQVTYLHCSSAPDSLDGIFLPKYNAAVIDGTAPHMTDAKLPGVYDTLLNFCDFIGGISEKEEALSESKKASSLFSEGYCYLKSAKALLNLMHTRSEEQLLEDEIRMFALDIAKRVSTFSADGFYKRAFLSAITAKGFCNFLKENLENYYTISVEAEVGDVSYRLMQEVAAACRLRNADMIVCPCPMNPHRAEHLLFPSANLALVTSNVYHPYFGADEIVPFGDFLTHRTSGRAPQLMYDGILHLATKSFSDAIEHHNRLEALYQTVTDYSKIDYLYQKALDFLLDS